MQQTNKRGFQKSIMVILFTFMILTVSRSDTGFAFTWLGDCDGNGIIDAAEVQEAADQYLETSSPQECNDEYGDGKVDISELQRIVNHAVSGCYAKDKYEDDDSSDNATIALLEVDLDGDYPISIPGYDWFQTHNFHDKDDEDWIVFHAYPDFGNYYKLMVYDVESGCDPVIEVYDEEGTLLKTIDNGGAAEEEEYGGYFTDDFYVYENSVYYFRITNYDDPDTSVENSGYKVRVIEDQGGTPPGVVYGAISPLVTGYLSVPGFGYATILPNGWYYMPIPAGDFTLELYADGYPVYEEEISVGPMEFLQHDIVLD